MVVRQTRRRLAILALVGAIAASWAVALGGKAAHLVPNLPLSTHDSAAPSFQPAACPFPKPLAGAFRTAARKTTIPPALLYAVAKVESNLQDDARSPVGARGLLQVMPSTAASLQLDPDQPETNILAGARYLRLLLDRFGSADTALAAYNAGPTAVAQAGNTAPSGDVVRYVANVDLVWHSVAGCR